MRISLTMPFSRTSRAHRSKPASACAFHYEATFRADDAVDGQTQSTSMWRLELASSREALYVSTTCKLDLKRKCRLAWRTRNISA
jgi:hypothetical protein